jgi:hypothetical protein
MGWNSSVDLDTGEQFTVGNVVVASDPSPRGLISRPIQ